MSLRLIHLSDIHFGCENKAAVEGARAFILDRPPDVLIVTGDMTQSGLPHEFDAAGAWLGGLPKPQVCTPGNHDVPVPGVIDRIVAPFGPYTRRFGATHLDLRPAPGLNVQGINTARGMQWRLNWSKGAIHRRDARRACEAMATAAPGDLKAVICHHPLMEITGGPMTGRVRGGDRASEILALGGADLILTGHVHIPFAHALPFGDRRTYAVGAGTLSHRERGRPAGFNVIDIEAECIRVAALAWTGSHFEVERSWGLDRRVPDQALAA